MGVTTHRFKNENASIVFCEVVPVVQKLSRNIKVVSSFSDTIGECEVIPNYMWKDDKSSFCGSAHYNEKYGQFSFSGHVFRVHKNHFDTLSDYQILNVIGEAIANIIASWRSISA